MELTNVSSKMIKQHIEYILESEYRNKVIIRTPLIPTMTATDHNIKSIANFLVNIYPEVKYEIVELQSISFCKI